jgi:MarR family transcriptional regulator, transcriptional regulator for hemolysin
MCETEALFPLPRHRSDDHWRNPAPGSQRHLTVNALCTFGFLRKEAGLYVQRIEQRAGALGLTLPQCKVLVYVADYEGIIQARLAELTNLEPMTLVRCLDRLESCGCLERRRDPEDRRARRIYLKARGKPLVDEIWGLLNLTRREAFAGISSKDGDLIIDLLEKIQRNLASLQPLPKLVPPNQ